MEAEKLMLICGTELVAGLIATQNALKLFRCVDWFGSSDQFVCCVRGVQGKRNHFTLSAQHVHHALYYGRLP